MPSSNRSDALSNLFWIRRCRAILWPGHPAELVPLRHDHQRISSGRGVVGVVGEYDQVAHVGQRLRRRAASHWIERANPGAGANQLAANVYRRRLPHVVGVRLERQAQDGNGLAFKRAERGRDLLHQKPALCEIDLDGGLDNPLRRVVLGAERRQCPRVLGKARAAVARSRVEELRADPLVEAHALHHHVHVGAHPVAQVGDAVHESDLDRQERVRRVLDHLRRLDVGHDNRRLDQVERPVDLSHHVCRPLTACTDHHPVRTHEVADRRPFAEELRIRDDVEGRAAAGTSLQCVAQPRAGADGHGALGDDDLVALEVGRQLCRHLFHLGEIGLAGFCFRCADRQENHRRVARRGAQVHGEAQAAGLRILQDQLAEAWFEERDLAARESPNAELRAVHTRHGMAEVGQTRSCDQTHVARADNGDVHGAHPARTAFSGAKSKSRINARRRSSVLSRLR